MFGVPLWGSKQNQSLWQQDPGGCGGFGLIIEVTQSREGSTFDHFAERRETCNLRYGPDVSVHEEPDPVDYSRVLQYSDL